MLLLVSRAQRITITASRLPIDPSLSAEEYRATLPSEIASVVQYVAYALGSPGPLRKCVAVWVGKHGDPLAVTKFATSATGDASVINETRTLRVLDAAAPLATAVPRVLAHGTLPTGRQFVTTTPMMGGRYSRHFNGEQLRFLTALAHSTAKTRTPYSQLPGLRLARSALEAGKFANNGRELLAADAALTRAQDLLDGVSGPTILAHRDFAPWNTRVAHTGLQVYDWEAARDADNPISDVLHFRLIQDALLHGRVRSNTLRASMEEALRFVAGAFPDQGWIPPTMQGLLLSYVLDILGQYAFADDGIRSTHPVIRAYVELLEALCSVGNGNGRKRHLQRMTALSPWL